ncbi:uncharacterized protein LOC130936647 isoform X1 [Arachis stenosperma]|uniref:uncharacterized protein LOC130936647 isoform X1 n=1 Tax=Arachis stenosperma TaxID=217475 RepID=UPI0025AC1903|nr:uncharacterized protein LOC130936647 isoform X1 [Arachis stenosperma]
MPGNDVGDRVHNFFGQENLSQGQYHSQAVDGNWPGLTNNLWAGGQRPTDGPFISNLKNFNLQQSDPEQGHTSSPHLRHGLNLAQSNLRPDTGRNQLPNQQAAVNGYMQGHQVFQPRQNEGNILGVDTEAGFHGIRGMPVLESQQGTGLELYKKNLTRTDAVESPVNYDFFGGQQQLSGRQSNMLQPLPRQQSGINDMQLLQQQVMLNQMQEFQRQQQFHQLDARQHSSMAPVPSISKQAVPSHSASLINGIPINEASNLMWQPEVMASNASWLQRSASPVMQGASNGLILSPDQVRLMGLVPNQGDQSLYGLPVSGSRGAPNLYPHVQTDKAAVSQVSISHQYANLQGDKPALPHLAASGNSFPPQPYGLYSDQADTNDGSPMPRQDIQGKNMFGSVAQGINMEHLQQVNSEQRNVPIEDFHGRQEVGGSSETSQEKMVMQVPPSQNVATLDPTEEKILFGSDDNLWDGFGRNTGFNMLDSADSFGGFPSLQSGSWSALMQSAVAETSSTETGIQEEWSRPSFRNNERSSGNERASAIDSSKQPVWADNNLQSAPNINSRPFLRPDDVSRPNSVSYSGVPGFHQSSVDTVPEQRDRLQTDTSQRSIPQFLERGKWLDCGPQQKPIAEGNRVYGNAADSSGIEINEKVISGSWTHQQMLPSPNSSGEALNRSNGWNGIKSAPSDNSSTLKARENENMFHSRHEDARQETSHVSAMWEPGSDTNSSAGLEHVKSPANMQICGEDTGMNGIGAIPNPGATWVSRQNNQQLHNVDAWRHSDSMGSYGNDGPGKYRFHMEKNPLVLESSRNEKLEGDIHDSENKNEKSADGVGSNSSHHRVASFDGSDSRSPKVSAGAGNRRTPVTRKFQFHPMGDVGVDMETHGNKHAINSHPTPHQPFGGLKGHDQSYPGQSKYGHSDENYTETEKRNAPAFQGETKSLDDNTSKTALPGQIPKTLAPFDRSVTNYALNKTASPSQNILELLHKVDQSREHGIATKTSTSNRHLSSRVPDTESSDGSQRNQSSSQGFGLQLAPPTQRLPVASSRVTSETVDKGNTWLSSTQNFPSRESSHELRNNISGSSGQVLDKASQYNVLGNMSQDLSSGFPFSRIHTQNQNRASFVGKASNSQSSNANFVDQTVPANQMDEYGERSHTSQSESVSARDMPRPSGIDQFNSRDPSMQTSASETAAATVSHPSVTFSASMQGTASKVLHNVWTNVSGKQLPNSSKIPSRLQPINVSETTTWPLKPGIEDSKDGNEISRQQMLPESVEAADETASASHVKEKVGKGIPDASQTSPAATSRDIEDFGRSLRPNNFLHQNFPLLNQVQSMKNIEIDPSNRDVKRFKVSDNVIDKQQEDFNQGRQSYGYDTMVKDVSGDSSTVLPADPNIPGFPTKPVDGRDTNASSLDVGGYGQKNALNVSNSNNPASIRSEHPMINPQMAPSWFEQYGTFKNGKMLPMYDARAMAPPKPIDQSFTVRNQSDSVHLGKSMEQVNSLGDAGNARLSPTPTSFSSEHVPSRLLPPAIESDLLTRPKKRKSSTSELIPFHKELEQGSERLQDISAAELDWAQAANRLVEKVEEDAEQNEEPTMKSRRRLVLTTQLMQQLFNPPPAAVLSADAKLNHESLVYSVARLVLGDACSSVSQSGSGGSKKLLHDKLKSSEKNDHYIRQVEDFVGRMRKLENDILRLDNRSSILDLRVECQDLERFSVINRFAKFHGRGQNDGAETSSADAARNAHKPSPPQRYVTAVPMPRNLPDRVQCLSL